MLKMNKEVIGWTFIDLKCISPSYCMRKIPSYNIDFGRQITPVVKTSVICTKI